MINRVAIVLPIHRLNTDIGNILDWLVELPMDYQLIVIHDVKERKFTREEVLNFEKLHPNLNITEGYFGGPGGARNEGLKLVNSKQVAFWDSDDLPTINIFNEILDKFIESKFEIAVNGYTKIDVKKQSVKIITPDKSNGLFQIANEVAIWRFIFKTKALQDKKFPELYLGEDQVFISRVMHDFEKLTTYSESVYNYRLNSNNQLTATSNKPLLIKRIIDELFFGIDSKNEYQQVLSRLLVLRLCISLLKIKSFVQVKILISAILHLIFKDLISFKFNFLIYIKFILYISLTKLI